MHVPRASLVPVVPAQHALAAEPGLLRHALLPLRLQVREHVPQRAPHSRGSQYARAST